MPLTAQREKLAAWGKFQHVSDVFSFKIPNVLGCLFGSLVCVPLKLPAAPLGCTLVVSKVVSMHS
jgi:hypothetical protein